MFTEPLFQDNILQTMYKFFSHYLSYQNWAWQFFGAMFFLYIIYKLLMYKNTIAYAPFFPTEKYYFSWKRNSDKFGIIFLLLCFGIYGWYLFFQEQSFFINYDTMGPNTMILLQKGVTPRWGINGRLFPVAFWDINIIYALTHNYTLLNIYILLQTIIIIYLLNKLLIFISPNKRHCLIGLLLIAPSFFWTNSISFPERMMLIFFIGSLIYLKKYRENNEQKSSLWFGILLMNFALYMKESTILIYFGILMYSFIYNLYNEKITLSSFIHPLKTCKQFPLEILIFISMLTFSIFYMKYVSAIVDNQYFIERQTEIINILKSYHLEIIVCFISLLTWLFHNKKYYLINSLVIGSIFSMIIISFIIKLYPLETQQQQKPYFLLLPYLISLITIIYSLKSKYAHLCILILLSSYSLYKNFQIYQTEEGTSYRQTAEFLTSQPEPLSIFISEYSEPFPWWVACSSTVYKYYWPTKNITFKTSIFNHLPNDTYILLFWNKDKKTFTPLEYQQLPQSGDFYVIKKTDKYHEDLAVIKDIQHELIYQNKLFEVYKIKG